MKTFVFMAVSSMAKAVVSLLKNLSFYLDLIFGYIRFML